MAQLVAKAKRMGMPPADYARRLIEDALALQHEAEESTFAQIMQPVRQATGSVEDAEIVKLVEQSRGQYHRKHSDRKKS